MWPKRKKPEYVYNNKIAPCSEHEMVYWLSHGAKLLFNFTDGFTLELPKGDLLSVDQMEAYRAICCLTKQTT